MNADQYIGLVTRVAVLVQKRMLRCAVKVHTPITLVTEICLLFPYIAVTPLNKCLLWSVVELLTRYCRVCKYFQKIVLENIALMAAHMPCRSQKYSSNVDTMSHHALYMR
jgi:hypothetical protein